MLHQVEPDHAALVADRHGAVRARLQKELRVAHRAGGDDHRLFWSDRQRAAQVELMIDVLDRRDE